MKFRFSLPKDEKFFSDYAGLTGTLKTLGYLAQVVSALTEFGVIFALVESSLFDFFPQAARPAGIFGAVIGTAFLELGLRKFLPYSAKAVLYQRFSGLHAFISGAVFAVTLGLLFSSGYLSFQGSKELVHATAPKPKLASLDSADSKEQAKRAEAVLQYSADSAEAVERYSLPLAAVREKYAAKLATEAQALNRLESKERTEGRRYGTQKAAIRSRILALQAQQAEEAADMENGKALALAAAIKARNNAFAKAESERDAQRHDLETKNAKAEAHSAQQVERYGSGLAWFTVVCMVVLLFSVSIDEIHKKGSGIEEVVLPTQYYFSQGVLAEFWEALSDKIQWHLRELTRRLAAGTPQPHEPQPIAELWDAPARGIRRKAWNNDFAPVNGSPVVHVANATNNAKRYTQQNITVEIDSSIKSCQHCGQQFRPKTTWQKYCTEACKLAFHAEKHGKAFNPSRYHKKA